MGHVARARDADRLRAVIERDAPTAVGVDIEIPGVRLRPLASMTPLSSTPKRAHADSVRPGRAGRRDGLTIRHNPSLFLHTARVDDTRIAYGEGPRLSHKGIRD